VAPYGKSTLSIDCSAKGPNHVRRIELLKMKTAKGEFVAPPELTSNVRNPFEVHMTSLGDYEVFIYITYQPTSPHTNNKTIAITFDNGKFHLP
jgi:hypothetical protein